MSPSGAHEVDELRSMPDEVRKPFLRSLDMIDAAVADLRGAADQLERTVAQTRSMLDEGVDIIELLQTPGTGSRERMIDALNSMHSALMFSRGAYYRLLIEGRGMSISEIARLSGHPRQLIKRRYDSFNSKLAQEIGE